MRGSIPTRLSSGSIAHLPRLRERKNKAKALGLPNVQFECLDLDHTSPARSSDLIVATHALVQAEQDPGIPSRRWNTFERAGESQPQADFERRTGIGSQA